ncbi:WG repeat-containing protein [Fusobacterium ulcerans]|uniref:WG repeat-containing protein n=1 Tax=Fusobacterium ulcerans TaxID=861 RepID=UPI00241E7D31|nr:WG repeat-containing protein [Fusobacterium ulcerans]
MIKLLIALIMMTTTLFGGDFIKINNFIVEEVPIKRKLENHKIVRVVDGDQASIGLYGIVDSKNNFITKPNNMLIAIKSNYIYLVDIDYREGMMTKDGKWIGEMGVYNYKDKESQMYSELKDKTERDLIIIYKKDGRKFLYGYLNFDGKVQIPMIYDEVNFFSEDLAAVKLNGKWGYINKNGNKVIDFKYSKAGSFQKGEALVRLDGKEFYINKLGNKKVAKSFFRNRKQNISDFFYSIKHMLSSLWSENIKEK